MCKSYVLRAHVAAPSLKSAVATACQNAALLKHHPRPLEAQSAAQNSSTGVAHNSCGLSVPQGLAGLGDMRQHMPAPNFLVITSQCLYLSEQVDHSKYPCDVARHAVPTPSSTCPSHSLQCTKCNSAPAPTVRPHTDDSSASASSDSRTRTLTSIPSIARFDTREAINTTYTLGTPTRRASSVCTSSWLPGTPTAR